MLTKNKMTLSCKSQRDRCAYSGGNVGWVCILWGQRRTGARTLGQRVYPEGSVGQVRVPWDSARTLGAAWDSACTLGQCAGTLGQRTYPGGSVGQGVYPGGSVAVEAPFLSGSIAPTSGSLPYLRSSSSTGLSAAPTKNQCP